MENERPKNYFESHLIAVAGVDPETGNASTFEFDCELDEPHWSVVSFKRIEAGGLTYAQAAALMNELDSHGIAGLCTVTDKAATRLPD